MREVTGLGPRSQAGVGGTRCSCAEGMGELPASHDACFCMLLTCWVAIKVLEVINVYRVLLQ